METYLCLYWDISISCSTGRNSRMSPIDISHLPSSSKDHVYPKLHHIQLSTSYFLNVYTFTFTISHHPYVNVLTIHFVYSYVYIRPMSLLHYVNTLFTPCLHLHLYYVYSYFSITSSLYLYLLYYWSGCIETHSELVQFVRMVIWIISK